MREIEGLTAMHVVEGYVWCYKHGDVHGDTLNPYGYIEDGKQDYCTHEEHDAIFMDSDRNVTVPKEAHMEYSGIEAEAGADATGGSCRVSRAGSSNPVRDGASTHAGVAANHLVAEPLDALPEDMIDEDRERIADGPAGPGDRHGATTSPQAHHRQADVRGRVADQMDSEPVDMYATAGRVGRPDGDAAEEIRSMLP